MSKQPPSHWPSVECCMGKGHEVDCICGRMERAIRAWHRSDDIRPMTKQERAECLAEITAVEGYVRTDHIEETDQELAGTTLQAWTDYCQDKGLM